MRPFSSKKISVGGKNSVVHQVLSLSLAGSSGGVGPWVDKFYVYKEELDYGLSFVVLFILSGNIKFVTFLVALPIYNIRLF